MITAKKTLYLNQTTKVKCHPNITNHMRKNKTEEKKDTYKNKSKAAENENVE